MAHFVFGGNPHCLLELNDLFIHYAYNTFYNKISGISLNQWLPDKLEVCQELIYNSVTTGAIEQIQLKDGQVVDREWVLHHFEYDSFRVFGFLDNFALPTAHPGVFRFTQREGFYEKISEPSIRDIFVNMVVRRSGISTN